MHDYNFETLENKNGESFYKFLNTPVWKCYRCELTEEQVSAMKQRYTNLRISKLNNILEDGKYTYFIEKSK